MKKYFGGLILPFALCLLPYFSTAQSRMDGIWKGIVTQEGDGGASGQFEIEIRIYKVGKKISGYSIVHWGDKFAKMDIQGTVERSVMVEISEGSVLDKSEIPGYDWCLKNMHLVLKEKDNKTLILEGFWEGKSQFGGCVPGKILVEKQTPRV